MHGDMRGFAALQADFGLVDLFDLVGGKQPHSVYEGKFSHGESIVADYQASAIINNAKMRLQRMFGVLTLLAMGANAQWLNFPTPGTPRTRDGKANLTAPAPRAADGKPDLSGVWMHELTSVAEMKRLYGDIIDAAVKVDVPGMEIGTQHKYAFNILVDFKPAESPMRPETAEIVRKAAADRNPAQVCAGVPGFPLAGFLSEPIKIIQAPRMSVVLMRLTTCIGKSTATGGNCPRSLIIRPSWATRRAIGSATYL